MVIDFDHLRPIVEREVIDRCDHRDLNEVLDNPTAELLAHRAWRLLSAAGLELTALRLWETTDSSVDLAAGPRTLTVAGHLVVLSGGLDSTVCMALADRDSETPPLALTFDYGQRHRTEFDRAAGVAGHYRSDHLVVQIDTAAWGGSALTDPSIDVPTGGERRRGIPVTYVPARNSIFLAVALGVAEARDLDAVWIGVNAIDYSGYPDCRPEFIEAFRGVAATGQKRGVEGDPIAIRTPLIDSTKAEIVAMGRELGAPLDLTWSCYQGGDTPVRCLRRLRPPGPGLRPGRRSRSRAPVTDPHDRPGGHNRPGASGDILATEVFSAIQGEAALVGERQVFVRLTGCNIRCAYCDQPEALEQTSGPVPDRTDSRSPGLGGGGQSPAGDGRWPRRWRPVPAAPPPFGQPHRRGAAHAGNRWSDWPGSWPRPARPVMLETNGTLVGHCDGPCRGSAT